ncbi:MAG: hypothetical protein D4R79_12630 [Comamonadaceae bacterium]|nr:MAG: hypothetical protein D4R79_12630 [Comamonadaceae bacterium]
MNEITAGELFAKNDALENEAASLLGHMIFEFSRLDMNLGLCLVWVDSGARVESLTKTVETQNLKIKLDELTKHVIAKLRLGSKQRSAYENWIERVNSVRQQRNNLVHGRWGVEAHKNKVINVIGLPTSSAQQVIEYTLDELAEVNEELRDLQRELGRLREHWPL